MQAVFQFIRLAQQHFLCGRRRLAAQRFCVCLEFLCKDTHAVRHDLYGRGDGHLRDLVGAALRLRVKIRDGVDLVAPEFHTHRCFSAGGVEVHNAAAARKLTRAVNLIGAHIATAHQRPHNLIHRNFLSGREFHRALFQLFWRQNILQCRVDRRHNAGALPGLQQRQCFDALALIFMRAALRVAQAEIAQGVKRRSHAHRVQVFQHTRRFCFVARNKQRFFRHGRKQRVQNICFVNGSQTRHGHRRLALPHSVFDRAVFRHAPKRVIQKIHTHSSVPFGEPLRNYSGSSPCPARRRGAAPRRPLRFRKRFLAFSSRHL